LLCSTAPDLVSDIVTGTVEFVVQYNFNALGFSFEARKIAFIDIDNLKIANSFLVYFKQPEDSILPYENINYASYLKFNDLNKPPALNQNQKDWKFFSDRQNSNYANLLGANY
jgi:hypothetical protein